MSRKRKVAYYYDGDASSYNYGTGHPMKPQRVELTHDLLDSLGVLKHVSKYQPLELEAKKIEAFHTTSYIDFMRGVTTENIKESNDNPHNLTSGGDCPVFNGIWKFNQRATGASVGAAYRLNRGQMDMCINWGGGFHHAKRNEASGFCYLNDIVLGILELCRHHPRVLYIDIDIHHGDGVEEAFWNTDRVCTVSFHKYGENFFPKSGHAEDIGAGAGTGYAINVPLHDGMTDDVYTQLYDKVMSKVMEWYRPTAVVFCCGADSLAGDRLGTFNLSEKGHAHCIEFIMKYNLPILLTGGGGYTVRNVARCWAYETAMLVGKHEDLPEMVPMAPYWDYYAPDYHMGVTPEEGRVNRNSPKYLDDLVETLTESMRNLPHAPSVPIAPVSESLASPDEQDSSMDDTPSNQTHRAIDPKEFYESPQDQDAAPSFHSSTPTSSNQMPSNTQESAATHLSKKHPLDTSTSRTDAPPPKVARTSEQPLENTQKPPDGNETRWLS